MKSKRRVGFIWDIDGVVVDSPHEDAWRATAEKEPWNTHLESDFYFSNVASLPRYRGGDSILRLLGVYERLGAKTWEEKNELLEKFCTEKNELLKDLIGKGKFKLFPDAVRLLLKAKSLGILQASASASKNARDMLLRVGRARIRKEMGEDFGVFGEGETLHSMFDVDACGIKAEKRDIQELAGKRLRVLSQDRIKKLIVFEDAPSGIRSAKSLGYYVVGVLRIGNEGALKKAGADIVTEDLEKTKIEDSNL